MYFMIEWINSWFQGSRFCPSTVLSKPRSRKAYGASSSDWYEFFHFTATVSGRGKSPRRDNQTIPITGLNYYILSLFFLWNSYIIWIFQKVWLSFLTTTSVFVFLSAKIIKNRMDMYNSNLNRQSIGKAVYNQIDYVIRLFTNQGAILKCNVLYCPIKQMVNISFYQI